MKKTLVRKSWPKIRVVSIGGQNFYRMDARRTGTDGKQESFRSQKEAEQRAAEVAAHFSSNGTEGLAFPVELRGMALAAERMLRPHGKTLLQAAEFYAAHLEAEQQRMASALVPTLAEQWHEEKNSGKTKQLRAATLKGIRDTTDTLQKIFEGKRVMEVTTKDINRYLDKLEVGLQRKFNVHSLFSQFFNWCIARKQAVANPCEGIDIHVNSKDVAILSPAETLQLMTRCRETSKFRGLVLYHAISLFGGLRPSECLLLRWENIHLEEKTITVLGSTSKIKETRNVPIEANLLHWLEAYAPSKPQGLVTSPTNLSNLLKKFHAVLGYRIGEQNPNGQFWPQDVMRHSYGSYWLAKYKQRAVLAEHMGNSLAIIKKHYKRVVGNAACEEYWRITPTYDGRGEVSQQMSAQAVADQRRARIAAALAGG